MKKTILVLAGLGLGAAAQATSILPDFANAQYTVNGGYESKHIVRGLEEAGHTYTADAKVDTGSLYLGALTNQPRHREGVEVTGDASFYAGYKWALGTCPCDDSTIVGDIRYLYSTDTSDAEGDNVNHYNELAFGIRADDKFLEPSLYVYYTVESNGITPELSIGHTFWLINGDDKETQAKEGEKRASNAKGVKLVLSNAIGYTRQGDMGYAGQVAGLHEQNDSYFYNTAKADIVWNITDMLHVSVGGRWSVNSSNTEPYATRSSFDNNSLWYGAEVGLTF